MKVQDGQSVFDIAVQQCGSVESAYTIALANGVSITDMLVAGMEIKTPAIANVNVAKYFTSKNITPATFIKYEYAAVVVDEYLVSVANIEVELRNWNAYRAVDGQSMFDIAVQMAGGIEQAYAIALANKIYITDIIAPGQNITISGLPQNDIANYFANRKIVPATSGIWLGSTDGEYEISEYEQNEYTV